MSWIKEANKLGKYEATYLGFRVYCIKEGSFETRIEEREDGAYRITDFTKGELVAIDKSGFIIKGTSLEDLGEKIDIIELERYFDKKEK